MLILLLQEERLSSPVNCGPNREKETTGALCFHLPWHGGRGGWSLPSHVTIKSYDNYVYIVGGKDNRAACSQCGCH